MSFWSIIGTGKEGELEGRTFGLTLNTESNTWNVGGPSAGRFFETRNGTYRVVAVPENGTRLEDQRGEEVAFCRGLNGSSAVGSVGTGRASEAGANFDWRLDSR